MRDTSLLPDMFPLLVRTGAPTDCWPWLGVVSRFGYGIAPGNTGAQAWAYRLFVGPVDKRQRVLPACGNKLCCNPRHLKRHVRT